MTEEFKAELRQKSPEELRNLADQFREFGWESQAEACEAVLQQDKGKPTDPDSDVVNEDVATLRDKLEWFREQGWDSNAEQVEAELSRKEGLDSAEELDESEEELTHSAELSEDDTVEIKFAKFYSTGDSYRDFDEMTEAEKQALENEGVTYPGP